MSPRQAGPGRPPASFVRIERTKEGKWRLFLGRALWRAAGEPSRVDVTRDGSVLRLKTRGAYAVSVGSSIPRLTIGAAAGEKLELRPGRFQAAVVDGEIEMTFEPHRAAGAGVWLVRQTAGHGQNVVWRIRDGRTRHSNVLWQAPGTLTPVEAMHQAHAWCAARGYRVIAVSDDTAKEE